MTFPIFKVGRTGSQIVNSSAVSRLRVEDERGMASNEPITANASPSKAFFIEMLTKDITLADCILDLADNSIHRLITKKNLDVSEHLFAGTTAKRITGLIEITLNPSSFTIKDDSGGISIEEAEEEVFLLGNPVREKRQAGLGVYGIGMKRALFKIGKQIAVASHTIDEEFRIDIPVDEWEKTDEWFFQFTYAREKESETGGTRIEVTKLGPGVGQQFGSKSFKTILLEKISKAYALFLKAGLRITVNGDQARAEIPEFAEAKGLNVARQKITEDGVDILIMAGVSAPTDRTPRGWYIFCNGRMVLDANQNEETGWGADSHPGFHAKYNHFLGYVYFRSKDVQKLPWKTTKDGVERESHIYQRALAQMRLVSRPILNFLNDLYPDVKEQSEPEHSLFQKAKPVPLQRIASRHNTAFKPEVKRPAEDAPVSIQYKRSKKKIDKIRQAIGRSRMAASRIGAYTFDWFYDRNCK